MYNTNIVVFSLPWESIVFVNSCIDIKLQCIAGHVGWQKVRNAISQLYFLSSMSKALDDSGVACPDSGVGKSQPAAQPKVPFKPLPAPFKNRVQLFQKLSLDWLHSRPKNVLGQDSVIKVVDNFEQCRR
jgi:hypothetical protein